MWSSASFNFDHVVGERSVEVRLIIEVHYEDFVLRIAGAHQVQAAWFTCRTLVAHGAGVINKNAECDGDVFATERSDALRLPIFENCECVAIEIGNRMLLFVDHTGVKLDLFYLFLDDKGLALPFCTSVPCPCAAGCCAFGERELAGPADLRVRRG